MSKFETLRGTGPAVFHPQVLGGKSTRVAESNAHCEGGCECGGADCPTECPCAANEDIQRPGGPSPNVANHKDEEMGMGEDDLEDREDEDDGDIFPSSKGEDDGEVIEPSNEDDGEIVAKKESLQMKRLRRLSESVLGEAVKWFPVSTNHVRKAHPDLDKKLAAFRNKDKALKLMSDYCEVAFQKALHDPDLDRKTVMSIPKSEIKDYVDELYARLGLD